MKMLYSYINNIILFVVFFVLLLVLNSLFLCQGSTKCMKDTRPKDIDCKVNFFKIYYIIIFCFQGLSDII